MRDGKQPPNGNAVARVDTRNLSDGDLVRLTLDGNQAGWREIIHRYDQPLRQSIIESSPMSDLSSADIDDLMGDFWLSLVEADMRRLRSFNPSRGASLLSWLTIQLARLQRATETARSAEPEMISVDEARGFATRRVISIDSGPTRDDDARQPATRGRRQPLNVVDADGRAAGGAVVRIGFVL